MADQRHLLFGPSSFFLSLFFLCKRLFDIFETLHLMVERKVLFKFLHLFSKHKDFAFLGLNFLLVDRHINNGFGLILCLHLQNFLLKSLILIHLKIRLTRFIPVVIYFQLHSYYVLLHDPSIDLILGAFLGQLEVLCLQLLYLSFEGSVLFCQLLPCRHQQV